MPFGFLALLAAFGALANSLRSNSASALIRTLLRCSARPNGGGYLTARPLRELRPGCSSASRTSPRLLVRFAHFAGVGVSSFLYPHFFHGHGTPCPYDLNPHSSPLTPHPSLLTPHPSLLTPHPSPLTPHPSPLTPPSSLLTPHPSLLTPHSSLLRPHPSLLTPHPSPLTSKPKAQREHLFAHPDGLVG